MDTVTVRCAPFSGASARTCTWAKRARLPLQFQWTDCHKLTVYAVPPTYSPCSGVSIKILKLHMACLQIVHSFIGVLTIILQQHNHQMPSQPRPLGMTIVRETSSITYYGRHVIKEVSESMFTQMHWQGLNAVYTFLVKPSWVQNLTGSDQANGPATAQAQCLAGEAASWLIVPAASPIIPAELCQRHPAWPAGPACC